MQMATGLDPQALAGHADIKPHKPTSRERNRRRRRACEAIV